MTPAQRKQLKKLLEAMAKKLSQHGAREVAAEDAGKDEDLQPLNEMGQAIASNRNKRDQQTLVAIERALKKLHEDPDEFGLCEECGEDIAFARLKAMPYAALCVDCQSKKDPARPTHTRRHLTDYVD